MIRNISLLQRHTVGTTISHSVCLSLLYPPTSDCTAHTIFSHSILTSSFSEASSTKRTEPAQTAIRRNCNRESAAHHHHARTPSTTTTTRPSHSSAVMGALCGKESKNDNFAGAGRTLGAAPPPQPSTAPIPASKRVGIGGPARTLGEGGSSDDPREAARKAAEVCPNSGTPCPLIVDEFTVATRLSWLTLFAGAG